MATSRTGQTVTNRSGFFQIVVVAAVVLLLLVITFVWTGAEPDVDTETEAAGVEQRPAGAGTIPEGESDPEIEGITDEVGEVDPAAPDVDSVPAAEPGGMAAETDVPGAEADADAPADADADAPAEGDADAPAEGDADAPADGDADAPADGEADAPAEGEADAPGEAEADAPAADDTQAPAEADAPEAAPVEDGAIVGPDATDAAPDTDDAPAATDDDPEFEVTPVPDTDAATEPADGPIGSPPATQGATETAPGADGTTTEEGFAADEPVEPTIEAAPDGRDAGTDLTVEPGQDVVTDPDGGGTPFIPTPSGPAGRDGDALTTE